MDRVFLSRQSDRRYRSQRGRPAQAKKRILFAGLGVSIPAIRISLVGTYRDFGLFAANYQNGSEDDTPASHAKPYSAVMALITSTSYRCRTFIRGLADQDIHGNLPLNITPSTQTKFNSWVNQLLTDNWSVQVQARFPPLLQGGKVVAATNAAPIQITTDAAHGLNKGDKVFLRAVKGNKGANGTYFVDIVDATNFTMRGSAGTGMYISGGFWRKVFYVYVPIQTMVFEREVSHRTGRPFDSPVGRRRRRAPSA